MNVKCTSDCTKANKSTCPHYSKKEDYRLAKKQFPNIDNPMENWQCNPEFASQCKHYDAPIKRLMEKEFQEKQCEMMQNIPAEFHNGIAYLAWEQGHAYGFEEVLLHLSDIIDAIEKPLEEYTKRILNEN
jgi:hypothetical protein